MAVLASALLLANLGGACLWQDEAQTALIAGTVLSHGVPLGHDGKNSFSQDRGLDYGKNYVWLWHPWLSFYVLAGFFALFGKSTLVARLPFALFGIATVVLAGHFARVLWGSRRAGFLAALVLLLNVPFLVLVRQCRYYAPGMFFALLALYGYCALLERRRFSGMLFAASAIALFHTQYVHYAALLVAVAVHALLFRRDRLRPVLVAAGVTALVSLPWIFWFSTMGKVVGQYAHIGSRSLVFAQYYLQKIDRYVFPALLLLLALAVWGIGRTTKHDRPGRQTTPWPRLALLLLFIATNLAAVCLTSTYPFFRFIAPVIPTSCLVIALLLDSVAALHRIAGPLVAGLILVVLGHAWSMPDYLYEITHRYEGPVEGIVGYLEKHAAREDVVAITYEDLPVKFYTGLRVLGGLTGEDLTPARTADWVIIRKHVVSDKDLEVRKFLVSQVPLQNYSATKVGYPDITFQNREEPGLHLFRTAKDDSVVIFHRIGSRSPST